jgi:hypothetical protein
MGDVDPLARRRAFRGQPPVKAPHGNFRLNVYQNGSLPLRSWRRNIWFGIVRTEGQRNVRHINLDADDVLVNPNAQDQSFQRLYVTWMASQCKIVRLNQWHTLDRT